MNMTSNSTLVSSFEDFIASEENTTGPTVRSLWYFFSLSLCSTFDMYLKVRHILLKKNPNELICLKCVVLSYSTFLANLMKHIPSGEANSSTTSQEIPWILCNRKVHYCILIFYIFCATILYSLRINTNYLHYVTCSNPGTVQFSTCTSPTHPIS